ncbi:hypothetical protein CXG81DRAFT_7888, partial [Caulochytrium protostelioides]
LPNPPTLIEYRNLRFLIFDAPSDRTGPIYLKELQRHHVTDVVRVCEPTYERRIFQDAGIELHELPFADGEAPPAQIVIQWLALVAKRFGPPGSPGPTGARGAGTGSPRQPPASAAAAAAPLTATLTNGTVVSNPAIGVHCVAGLGRAPVLVAMALIEAGMAPLDSVIFIRERRRGAINNRQLKYIESYKRRASQNKSCSI